jgi:acyl-CoA thioesterase-1
MINPFKTPYLPLLSLIFILSCSDSTPPEQSGESKNAEVASESAKPEERKKFILFFGNSLTAGYGLESHESFPSLIQARIDSLGMSYEVINAGVSGETTATGSNRVKWVLERQPVDVFVLELGANDGLRGTPVAETKKNLEKIIDTVRGIYPQAVIILAGMMVPPSMGPEYSAAFTKVFPEVAESMNVKLIPFLLEDVAGIDSLNLPDGIHPNAQGQKIVCDNVWETLASVLPRP